MSVKKNSLFKFDFKDPYLKHPDEKENFKKIDLEPSVIVSKKKILSIETPSLKYGRNDRRIARILAVQSLYAYEIYLLNQSKIDLEKLLLFDWDNKANKKAKEFASYLIKGALEHIAEIDQEIIPNLSGWIWERISITNKVILRVSLFQLLKDKNIPSRVVINEAVDLAKLFSTEEDPKFINAILDKIIKNYVSKNKNLSKK